MLRSEVVQQVLNLYNKPRYLEIGVYDGETFNAVHAEIKVAVDIKFSFNLTEAKGKAKALGDNIHYHECHGDRFF
jgi:hypothetical protein